MDAKAFVDEYLGRNTDALNDVIDALFWYGEPAMQEVRSAALLTKILEDGGFTVERGISGFPTGFMATFGSGGPVVAVHAEYDGAPDNSQLPGVSEHKAIIPGAPGHCEGHNVNAAVMVAAARAVSRAMRDHGIKGTLKIFGAPAEELVLARPYYVRDGYFDDVDVAFHPHLLERFSTEYGVLQRAVVSAEFVFHGETAHAAMSPWKGRNALDAALLMDSGMAQYREHLSPGMNMHRVVTDGGNQPNVIPARAAIWWFFRDHTAEGAKGLFERARKVAEGAALMTNTELEVVVKTAVWPVRGNEALAHALQRNIETVGMPAWSNAEHDLANRLQAANGAIEEGLRTAVDTLDGPSESIPAANDCGDVSWKVPMGRLWFPANVPGVTFHHWSAGAALATSIAHKGGLVGARALAATLVDCFTDPAIIADAKATFADETKGTDYAPMIPDTNTPPLDTNRQLMEKFRPSMEARYVEPRHWFE
ncbi:MAG: amidohydrolase [Rhodospirillaceae bacterium]|jgi:aminobenzoyl-glutamate utilization protein B|nr:amidohydrolase [Rhodospirillaceae bacterium]